MNEAPSTTVPAAKSSARDFILYASATITLYVSVVALVTLLFQYIDLLFPRDLGYWYDPYQGPARFAIATLIVVFPLYVFFTRKLNQDTRTDSSRVNLPIRKWLLYITLFVAGVTLAIDLIVLLNTFLGGEEITAAFLLKVVTVLAIVGGALWYYLQDLKGKWMGKENTSKQIGYGVSALVVVSIIGGFFIMGSPQSMRALRYDQERTSHLSEIQYQVINFYQTKSRLPENLEELTDSVSGYRPSVDPKTGLPYTYTKNDALSFTLCGTFEKASPESSTAAYPYQEENWTHDAGEECFTRTIDPERYPPFEKPTVPRTVPAPSSID